jgi:hypothetical protein
MSRTTHPKVTTETSSATATSEVKDLLAKVTEIAGPAPALTAKARVRSLKLRKGGEKFIPTILALSERIGLNVPSHPVSAIKESLGKFQTLAPIHESVVSAEKHLGDAIFQAQAQCWEGATVHYSVLRRLAKTDGDIANALAPVAQFFAKKAPAVVKAEDAKRGHRKGATASKDAAAAPTGDETTSAQAPAAPSPAAATPAAVQNGAAHS